MSIYDLSINFPSICLPSLIQHLTNKHLALYLLNHNLFCLFSLHLKKSKVLCHSLFQTISRLLKVTNFFVSCFLLKFQTLCLTFWCFNIKNKHYPCSKIKRSKIGNKYDYCKIYQMCDRRRRSSRKNLSAHIIHQQYISNCMFLFPFYSFFFFLPKHFHTRSPRVYTFIYLFYWLLHVLK